MNPNQVGLKEHSFDEKENMFFDHDSFAIPKDTQFSTTGSQGTSVLISNFQETQYPNLKIKNPKYQPLEDNGVLYNYEDNPAVYKRIRK